MAPELYIDFGAVRYISQNMMEKNIADLFERTFGSEEREDSRETEESLTNFNARSSALETEDIRKKIRDEFGIDSYQARIFVIGVGGMGSNVVNKISRMGIKGALTVAVNTDAAHLAMIKADRKLLIGKELTRGLGAGGSPELGRKAAEESRQELKELLKGADMVFLILGLGGGTGTGAAPVIAQYAKEQGAIVIAVTTLPFKIEGARMSKAEDGLARLRDICDTVIVIENQKLLEYGGNLPIEQAFELGDNLISTMIKGITETISVPSLVNLDYADVRTIMGVGGVSAIGVGISSSSDRAREAVTKSLSNPLLEVDYSGAKGALIQVIGGPDLKLEEINLIGETVSKYLSPEAQTIWGARILPDWKGKIQVITIITGVKSPYILGPSLQETEKRQVPEASYESSIGIDVVK